MNIVLLYQGATAVLVLSLATFVLLKNPRSNVNKTYFIFCVFVIGFICANFLLEYYTQILKIDLALFAYRLAAMFGSLTAPAVVCFVWYFPRKSIGINSTKIIFVYFLGISSAILSFTKLYIADIINVISGVRIMSFGFMYYLFGIFPWLFVIYSLKVLADKYAKSSSVERNQIKYVFIGLLLGYVVALTFNLDIPILWTSRFEWIGPLGPIFLVICTAYAILRHSLMDIEVVIKRGVVYSLLTALLTGLFVSVILISEQLFRGIIGYSSLWPGIIAAFVIALIFQPLRDNIQNLVDRIFFRTRYDYQRIINKYSSALAQPMTDLDRFSRLAPYLLAKSMKLSGASVMVHDRESHCYTVRAGEKNARELEGYSVSEDSPLTSELLKRKRVLALEEVEYLARAEGKEKEKFAKIASEMKRLKTVLIIPSISESNYFKKPTLLSTINLGGKLSEESFSREDISFLRTLANQATISIEYAFIFEELEKNQERVVRSEKLAVVGTTTAGVAHELKNPLTYLSTLAQVLPKKWSDEEFRKSVGEMFPAEVQRMQLIVEGLLDYSRTRELTLKPLDIKTVVEKTIALLAYEIRKNNIYVKTDYRHSAKANGDPNRLMQVFMNLIANAVQAMGEKGGDLSIMTADAEGEVRISISDSGPGIPKDKLRKIFDPFFSTKEAGTGLGLSICKKIVDEHKGSIFVDSTPGHGTTFTVCLPMASL